MDFPRAQGEGHSVSGAGKEVSIAMKTMLGTYVGRIGGFASRLRNSKEHKELDVNL